MARKPSQSTTSKKQTSRSSIAPGAIELSLEDFGEPHVASPPPLAPALQRRQFTRVQYVTLARLLHGTHAMIARIEDLSEGGMRMRCPEDVPVETSIDIHFALPITGEPVAIRASVRWSSSAASHHLLGLSFETLEDAARLTFIRYVTVMSTFGV